MTKTRCATPTISSTWGRAPVIHGGKVVAEGTAKEVMAVKGSITGQYLSGARSIAVPDKRRPMSKSKKITITGATANNLQKRDGGHSTRAVLLRHRRLRRRQVEPRHRDTV